MYYLSVCAVVKDEALYIKEWIEFHLLQGVEHFYIYDNYSSDTTRDILKPYIDSKLVTLAVDTRNPIQFVSYNDCIRRYKNKSEWIAFIDCDEFLHGIKIPIAELLPKYSVYGGVAVNWRVFGSNGHIYKPNGLVIESYTRRQADINPHVKTIVNTEYVQEVGKNPHYFITKKPVVDEHFNKLEGNYALQGKTADIMAINHYHLKSKHEYFLRKLTKPDPGLGVIRSLDWVEVSFAAHDRNDIEDLSAASYADKVKANL